MNFRHRTTGFVKQIQNKMPLGQTWLSPFMTNTMRNIDHDAVATVPQY
ncbi:MAG: hypothetical protein WA738_20670 [Candidatus Angelobacter sp.]